MFLQLHIEVPNVTIWDLLSKYVKSAVTRITSWSFIPPADYYYGSGAGSLGNSHCDGDMEDEP